MIRGFKEEEQQKFEADFESRSREIRSSTADWDEKILRMIINVP